MTTPPLPPRPSVGRSSFAIAMKDYTFIRPGIAVTISGAALVLALVMGLVLIRTLGTASRTVERGARAVQLLHAYNAGLEVWRDMATNPDPAYRRPQAIAQRDSLRRSRPRDPGPPGHDHPAVASGRRDVPGRRSVAAGRVLRLDSARVRGAGGRHACRADGIPLRPL